MNVTFIQISAIKVLRDWSRCPRLGWSPHIVYSPCWCQCARCISDDKNSAHYQWWQPWVWSGSALITALILILRSDHCHSSTLHSPAAWWLHWNHSAGVRHSAVRMVMMILHEYIISRVTQFWHHFTSQRYQQDDVVIHSDEECLHINLHLWSW